MERLWTRPFVQLTLGMLFLFTAFYLLLPTLPLYITALGGNDFHVGLAAGAFTIAAVIARPYTGILIDRHGRRPFAVAGLAVFALAMYLYDWVAGVAVLLAIRMIHGIGWAFSTTAVATAVTDIIPPSRRGEGIGWYGSAMTAAMAVGPMLGVWIESRYSFHGIFLIAAGLSAVALLAGATTPMPHRRARGEAGRSGIYEKNTLPLLLSVILLSVGYGAVMTFFPLFAESIGVNAGTFFLIYAVVLALVRPVAGKRSDRLGEAAVFLPAAVITVAALLTLGAANGLGGVVLAAVLYGIGIAASQPALQAAILRLVPKDRTGVANASLFTAFDLGIAAGSIALGWVAQMAGYRAAFVAGAVSIGLSFVLFAARVRPRLAEVMASTAEASRHDAEKAVAKSAGQDAEGPAAAK